jgi:lactoylglutathione lyase
MKLAKPCIDVGLATHAIEPMLAFWQGEVGVPFDHALKVRRGVTQHRHDLMGSVLKINHVTDVLPDTPPSGYRGLLVAREGLGAPQALVDPDGNHVMLVPPGFLGVTGIGMKVVVRDVAAQLRFWCEGLGATPVAGGAGVRLGSSVLVPEQDDAAPQDAPFEGRGWRYVTLQVFGCDSAHARALAHGGREALAPATHGDVARYSMVKDPAGNWIELSQRKSLVGTLEAR